MATSLCSSAASWEATCLSLYEVAPHPSTSPLGGDPSEELLGCLLPMLASGLVLAGKAGWGASLAAARLRLHPSLTGLGGCVALLEKYLRDSLSRGWKPQRKHNDLTEIEATISAAWASPHLMLAVGNGMAEKLGLALKCLAADR